jgi:DNA-binding transcriptional regulator YiaG
MAFSGGIRYTLRRYSRLPVTGCHDYKWEELMGKIETTLKAEITRLSRHETKGLISKSTVELRRLRQRVASLEHEVRALKASRAEDQTRTKIRTATETVAGEPAVRLSPRLIRSLRSRLGISQAELAKLVGMSTVAVGSWESGKSKPKSASKARIAALRSLGRREVRRLLAE